MLEKEKDFEKTSEPDTGKIIEEKKFSMNASHQTKDGKTVIGEHISIEGLIRGEEHLLIEGSMKGNIELAKHNFVVGSRGRFEGEILAQNVGINGQMIGTVKTKGKVEIKKEADMSGDIKAKSISVEEGAYFKGSIELDREPHRKAAIKGKPIEMVVSQSDKASATQPEEAGKKS
jgi:cytoskeletal protein CcmA (bactofilin family)